MANTFKLKTKANIGVTTVGIYTVPSATQTTAIGLVVANKTLGTVTANVRIGRSGSNYSIVEQAPILTGSSLVVIGGDQKLVLKASDSIQVTSSVVGSADAILSVLEIS